MRGAARRPPSSAVEQRGSPASCRERRPTTSPRSSAASSSRARPAGRAARAKPRARPTWWKWKATTARTSSRSALRWLDPATKLQCAEFDKAATGARCLMKTEHKHFCIDRYEWPNKVGALPAVHGELVRGEGLVRGHRQAPLHRHRVDARVRGPRAPARTPTATATRATTQACNIDKPYIWPHPEKVYDPDDQRGGARAPRPARAQRVARRRASARTACTT